MLLVGLDAASQLEKFGYAVGVLEHGFIDVQRYGLLSKPHDALGSVVAPILQSASRALVAAKDFLECETLRPKDDELARLEGWIWVRNPQR